MRKANIPRNWGKLLGRDKNVDLPLQITIVRHPLFLPGQQVRIDPGITVVCGPNGSGKSKLINLIVKAFSSGANDDVEVVRAGGDGVAGLQMPAVQMPLEAYRLGIFRDLTQSLGPLPIPQDDLDPVGESKLDSDFVSDVSYILGKRYEEFAIYDLASEVDGYESLPYVCVNDGLRSYAVNEMGDGELSAIYHVWSIRRASPNSLLIIEEPETYLSPSTQVNLMDYLAGQAVLRNISVIVTTHSPDLLAQVSLSKVLLLRPSSAGTRIEPVASYGDLREAVGLSVSRLGCFVVEDRRASDFLSMLLDRLSPEWNRWYRIRCLGGAGDVGKFTVNEVINDSSYHVICIVDGDMRSALAVDKPNLFALPTTKDPDVLTSDLLKTGAAELAVRYDLDVDRVEHCVFQARSLNVKDQVKDVAEKLSIDPSSLAKSLFRLWLNDENNLREAKVFVDSINDYIKTLKPE